MNESHNAISSSEPEVPAHPSRALALGLAALAVLLYLVLIDAAVESFVSHSPLRWIICGAVAAYVALSVLLWRKLGWTTKASVSFFVLFSLMAFAAWRPEGSDSPLTLLRQPTSTLLSAATILGILLAGWILVRLKFLPWPARVGLVLLAAYGVAGFVVGVTARTPYAALLHGGSLWEKAPFWLQGAFLGGLVVLPAALLLQLVTGVSLIRAGKLREWGGEVLALGMCATIAASGMTSLGSRSASTAQPAQISVFNLAGLSPAEKAARRKQLADYMGKLYDALDAAAQNIPRQDFDAQAILQKIGNDPEKLFEWVRDNTWWVPYRGALRGPAGVLMDRLGNSVDRSLLLAELLRLAGHNARLARADLTQEQAQKLLVKVRPASSQRELRAPARRQADVFPSDEFLQAAGLSAPEFAWVTEGLRKISREQEAEYRGEVEEAKRRVTEQVQLLRKALGEGALATQPEAPTAAMGEHWWVQMEESGNWTDLDLLSADPKSGERPTEPTDTFAPGDGGRIQLESRFCHELVIRVVAEQWKQKALQEHVLLQHTVRPSEIIGQPITLRHVPRKWPANLGSNENSGPLAAFEAAVLAQQDWVPVLRIGEHAFTGTAINTAGELVKQAGNAGKTSASPVGGLLGGMGGEEESAPAPQTEEAKVGEGLLTAEWIEYELRAPGSEPRTVHHTIFDMLGPAARSSSAPSEPRAGPAEALTRGLALLDTTEVLPLVCDISPGFMGDLMYRQLHAERDRWLEMLREEDPSRRQELLETMPEPTGALGPLYAYASASRMLSPIPGSVFQDSIGLVNFRAEGGPNEKGGLEFRGVMDIVASHAGVLPGDAQASFAARLQQGVADTAAEHLVLGSAKECGNTTTVFALASARGLGTVAVRDRSEPGWRNIEASPDVRARVEKDLADGYVVVLPTKPVEQRLGWWRVDPHGGSTVGVMDEGFHQEATERVEMEGALDTTRISDTVIRRPGAPVRTGWGRHWFDILRDYGISEQNPMYRQCINAIMNVQDGFTL
jgi:hypothetical protein